MRISFSDFTSSTGHEMCDMAPGSYEPSVGPHQLYQSSLQSFHSGHSAKLCLAKLQEVTMVYVSKSKINDAG